jgi:hypothetical protein
LSSFNPNHFRVSAQRAFFWLLVFLIFPTLIFSQTTNTSAIKFSQFDWRSADDVQAYLDLFARELQKDSKVKGLVVGYRSDSDLPGSHLRTLSGYFDYLVDKRGISAQQLRIVDRGVRLKPLFELWIVPPGENIPPPTKVEVLKSTPFDLVYTGSGCLPEFTLDRYEVTDAVSFYSDALKQHPEAKGLVFIPPSTTKPLSQARDLISVAKSELEKAGLPPNLIVATPEPRGCHEVAFWLLPSTLTFPSVSNYEQYLFAQLMVEAEENQFTVCRVEFQGNTWISDQVLRRKIPGLNEGEVFRRDVLNKSLASLSQVPSINKVRLQDVTDVRLDHLDRSIDLTILVRPRSRERR